VEIKGLFEAEVITRSQSRDDRNAALREALVIVLNRVMAGPDIMQDPTVLTALNNAAAYVDQYQYALLSGGKGANSPRTMRVKFNEETLMELMRSSRLSIWNEVRDEVLMWLVVERFGKKEMFDLSRHVEVNSALQAAVKLKGIPILLPLMDLEEKQQLSTKDVLSAYPEKLLAASERYDVPAILSGKIVKQRTCWRSEWTLNFNHKIEQWALPCTKLKQNLAASLQRVYTQLSVFYAVNAGQAQADTQILKIAGIRGMTAETNIKKYLRELPMVTSVKWIQVEQGRHVFQLRLSGTKAALQEQLELGLVLREKGRDAQDASLLYELMR
jgi:hypothetical protein